MPVVVRPICVDPGNRVLFEGTLGACIYGDCDLYDHAPDTAGPTRMTGADT